MDHPFTIALLKVIDENGGEVQFGFLRRWLAQSCTDVPIPRAWEVTGHIQILYSWIVELSEGIYLVDIPGRRSQRLYKVNDI